MIKLAVAGACGRMGRAILTLAKQDKVFQISGALESRDNACLGEDIGTLLGFGPVGVPLSYDPEQVLKGADVLIDFTHPSATLNHLKAVNSAKAGYVLGTTGLDDSIMKALKTGSKKVPIVQSPNMSIGVNLLFKLAEITSGALDETYDIEIAEIHHRHKKDAPSGTAMKLLEIMAKTRKRDLKKDTIYGREGEVGARPKGKIGVLALRGGDVVGDHTVSFLGDGERIELVHKASSRDAFAKGALHAAKFLAGKKNGMYNMTQVLGIE